MSSVTVRNPHSVMAILESRPKDIMDIRVPAKAGSSPAWERVEAVARKAGLKVTVGGGASKEDRGRINAEGGREGGGSAQVREREGITAEEIFKGAADRAKGKGLWLALDCLQDPHNVGAIFRAAGFFGVQGIIITHERSAPLSNVAYDVASGGIEHVPFAIQPNLQHAFEVAKENGLWILGTSEHSNDSYTKIERDRPWLLVLGNEEKGMRRLTEESCDVLCGIPPMGKGVTSLNVSVAAGILISRLTQPSK